MRRLLVCLLVGIVAATVLGDYAVAQVVPSQDHFESRRRDAEYRQKLRQQQAQANQRVVPTFTIPQPSYGGGYGNGYYDPRLDPRYDPRYYDPNYVLVPGQYQNVYGRLVYVPPHFAYVPR